MLVHNFPLVELIFSHGKNALVVCSYLVSATMQSKFATEVHMWVEDTMRQFGVICMYYLYDLVIPM